VHFPPDNIGLSQIFCRSILSVSLDAIDSRNRIWWVTLISVWLKHPVAMRNLSSDEKDKLHTHNGMNIPPPEVLSFPATAAIHAALAGHNLNHEHILNFHAALPSRMAVTQPAIR
jgi:hypothetical protein